MLPEQANIGSVQGARRREEAQQRVLDVELGSFTPLVVWNQWRNGKRVSAALKASRRLDSS